jgi:predicted dinucleotide-binding enzyme
MEGLDLLGREGGYASGADAVLVAVPGGQIAEALGRVSGLEEKVVVDATNIFGERNDAFPSLAAEVKSIAGGPVAKSFNTNFAVLYERIDEQRARPCNLFAAEEGARGVTEELIRDAGYEPVFCGGLENARLLEDQMTLISAINQGGLGRFFYRYAAPGAL